jgi:hypothetical protein
MKVIISFLTALSVAQSCYKSSGTVGLEAA